MDNGGKTKQISNNNGGNDSHQSSNLTITIGSKRIAERIAAAAAAAAKAEAEGESSTSSTSSTTGSAITTGTTTSTATTSGTGKKRAPAPIPFTKSTRPTRAVKNARKIYSPPTTPTPSSSTNSKRITRPTNKVNKYPSPPLPIKKSGRESMIKLNKLYFKQSLQTIEGQTKLIRRAEQDEKFCRTLIDSLNQHLNKVVENVRAKRTKGKGKFSKEKGKSVQLAEMKSSKKVDLNSPDSILTTINLSTIINRDFFNRMPTFYQYRLTKLLPKCDQVTVSEGVIAPSTTAFNNEFFSRALASFSYRLTEGRLTNEILTRLKREMEREKKSLDPFKVKHFEPFFRDPETIPEDAKKEYKKDLKYLSVMSQFYNGIKLYMAKEQQKQQNHQQEPNILQLPTSLVHFDASVTRSSGNSITKHTTVIESLNDAIVKRNDISATEVTCTATTNQSNGYKSNQRTITTTTAGASTIVTEFLPLVIPREKKTDIYVEMLDCFEQARFDAFIQALEMNNNGNNNNNDNNNKNC